MGTRMNYSRTDTITIYMTGKNRKMRKTKQEDVYTIVNNMIERQEQEKIHLLEFYFKKNDTPKQNMTGSYGL